MNSESSKCLAIGRLAVALAFAAVAVYADVVGPIPSGEPINMFQKFRPNWTRTAGEEPEPGSDAVYVAGIGERIYTNFEIESIAIAFPTEDVQVTETGIIIEANTTMMITSDEKEDYFCPPALCLKTTYGWRLLCFRDTDGDGYIDSYRKFLPGAKSYKVIKDLRFPYKRSTLEVSNSKSPSFRKELLYQGAAGGFLRLLYREFVADMIRPNFTQELTYDLGEMPMSLSFRELRLEVLSAGNEGLKYRLQTGLN